MAGRKQRKGRAAARSVQRNKASAGSRNRESGGTAARSRVLGLPFLIGLVLGAFALLPISHGNPVLANSFLAAGGLLCGWSLVLWAMASRSGRTLALEFVPRQPHIIQACAQLLILIYWSQYWPQVSESVGFIVAQLLFAYAFDALLVWSRREIWTLGFGVFPIVLSINLFLWFKPDWFYLQFFLVAAGFGVKELARWRKDGQSVHIFNPSSFPLAIASVLLLWTGTTDLTWGSEIAFTQLFPPHIYLLIFVVSLPGQFFFGVSLMSMAAVVTSYGFVLAYAAVTGADFFLGGFLPIASFFGMQLLFTDPATAPRSDLGRIFYGILYGFSVVGLYGILDLQGQPTFYDKLLAVPILNLMVQQIDALAHSLASRRLDPTAVVRKLNPRTRNLSYMAIWALVFAFMQFNTAGERDLARRNKLALDEMTRGSISLAVAGFSELVQSSPGYFWGQHHLGMALLYSGNPGAAVRPLEAAHRIRPQDWKTLQLLGASELGIGQTLSAAGHYREALQLAPDSPDLLTEYAFMLAVYRSVLDPGEALRVASRAVELTDQKNAPALDALAAAQAASGRFADAVRSSEQAEALHRAGSIPGLAEQSRFLGDYYRSGKPFVKSGGG